MEAVNRDEQINGLYIYRCNYINLTGDIIGNAMGTVRLYSNEDYRELQDRLSEAFQEINKGVEFKTEVRLKKIANIVYLNKNKENKIEEK